MRTGRTARRLALLGALALVAAVFGPAPPAGAASGPWKILNNNSGMCLVVRGTGDGAPAVQTQCGNWADQKWYWQRVPTDLSGPVFNWQLVNANSGKCLVVRGGADGAQAVQTSCNNRYRDQWWWLPHPADPPSSFHITNVNSGMSLVVRGKVDGAPVVQTWSGQWADQYWLRTT